MMENSVFEQTSSVYERNQNGELSLSLGFDENGEAFTRDLSVIPHFLVCGFSGAGKTSFVQSVMTQLCAAHSPDDVRFFVYDSKAVDYGVFNGTPHMVLPVITDGQRAADGVIWLNTEIKRRLKAFSDAGAKDLAGYNRKSEHTLPRIFAIFDDYSSASFNAQDIAAFTDVLKNGRIAGIHCVVVTSMPSARILKKDVISNLPCRISFCVSSRADSGVAIERNGAENLRAPGEMIFKYQNIFTKCNAVYIPFDDIRAAVESLPKRQTEDLDPTGTMAANFFAKEAPSQYTDKPESDELLPDAVDVIFETGQASVSMLQRRLKLGYSRAARIMDEMEEKGIIGPFDGSKPRVILITRKQWEEMQGIPAKPNVTREESAAAKSVVSKGPTVILRDFAEFGVVNGTIGVYGNKVHVSRKVMTRCGSGTTTAHFTGDSFSKLIYRKPRPFSPGYIEFKFKAKADFTNKQPHLVDVSQSNVAEFFRSEFGSAQAKIVREFLLRLAEDAHVPLREI